ncbi:MAG: endonuclease/exonuclease/phosphatase family protein [Myxococcaceae bacterium]
MWRDLAHHRPVLMLLLVWGAGCIDPTPATPLPDAVPEPTPVPVRIATWNLRQFPASPEAPGRFAAAVQALDVDLLAVQEVEDADAFAQLLQALPAFEGVLGPPQAGSSPLRVGVLWRRDRLSLVDQRELFTTSTALFPRPPVRVDFEVVDTDSRFTAINVHLKAGTGGEDEQQRIDSAHVLASEIDAIVAAGEDEVILLGDFNEAFTDPRAAEFFGVFEARAGTRVLTRALDDAGQITFLPAKLVLDHMVTTSGLDEELHGQTAQAVTHPAWEPDGAAALSDHRPVRVETTFR